MTTAVSYSDRPINSHPYAADSTEASWQDFVSLLKPGVMSLVVFTYICGALMAPGQMHPMILAVSTICVALGSGAAGAINMWYDRDIDAIMKRTSTRPIPAGKISPDDALSFGILLAVLSTILMLLATNILAAMLLASSIAFYIVIYTLWLKRSTPQNIVIGGAAGALPPMIGWAAVTNTVGADAVSLFMIIFLWTPPHFWALALHQADEYKRAGIPMLPVVKGIQTTYHQILIYTLMMIFSTYVPIFTGDMVNTFYIITATLLNLIFIYYAVAAFRQQTRAQSLKLFWYSIIYLFALFTVMIIDHYW